MDDEGEAMSSILLEAGQGLAAASVLLYAASLILVWSFGLFCNKPRARRNFVWISDNALVVAWALSLLLIIIGDLLR